MASSVKSISGLFERQIPDVLAVCVPQNSIILTCLLDISGPVRSDL